MKKVLLLAVLLFFGGCRKVWAISPLPSDFFPQATPTQEVIPTVYPTTEIKEKITEPSNVEVKEKFASLLAQQRLSSPNPTNFLKYGIRFAVSRGVPASTLVLVLLLPFIGTMIGFLQHFVGLTGFGIFIPAALAVTFLATGTLNGLVLLAVIFVATLFTGRILKKFHLYYWPRRAITLMIISMVTFFLLITSPLLKLKELAQVSIFPILLLILLSEEFTRAQLGKSRRSAIRLTLGTIVISLLGASIIKWEMFQKFILLNPEVAFLAILVINILIGQYGGWRLLEYRRFKSILEK